MKTIFLSILSIFLTFQVNAEEVYKGFEEDCKSLRQTMKIPSGDPNLGGKFVVSSPEATKAAKRLFSKISFLHKTRKEVISILGDPATISEHGVKALEGKDAKLVYRFTSGYSGYEYEIGFLNDVVYSVRVYTIK